jgi:O-antigen/teichoic acid export membrane protein
MEDSEGIENNLKLIAKSSVIVFIGVALSKIFSYAHRIIIAKYFGPEIYGLYSLAIIIFTFFLYFSTLGLTEGLLRYISLYRGKDELDKIKYLLKFSTRFLLFSGLFASVALFLLSEIISIKIFHNEGLIPLLKISSFLILINIFASVYSSILRAFENIFWYSFITNILQNVVKFLAIILLIFVGINSNSTIISFFIGITSMFFLSYYLCKTKLSFLFEKYSLNKNNQKAIKKKLIYYSIPVLFTTTVGTIFYWIDSFAIGYFENAESVGFYNAAIPIVILFGIATDLFMQLFYPIIVKEFSRENFGIIRELSKQVSKWILILNIPLFVVMFFFPGAIINLLFGEKYLVAESALKILSVGGFISLLTGLLTQMLLMAGKSKTVFINLLLGSIINFILNMVLIPKYSLQGAAFATVISWAFLTIILLVEVKCVLNFIPLKRTMLKVMLISAIPTLLLFTLKKYVSINLVSIILLMFFFVLSYFALILATRCLDKNDIMILKAFKKKIYRG